MIRKKFGYRMRVLAGIHSAGKTTIGNELKRMGLHFYPEVAVSLIGRKLPWTLKSDFDEQVITKELNRDSILMKQEDLFFVETWHVGNMAYANVRSPEIARKYSQRICRQVQFFTPVIYFLDITPEEAIKRSLVFKTIDERKQAIHFYSKVYEEFYRVFDMMDITPIRLDGTQNHMEVLGHILHNENLEPSYI